MSTTEVQQKLDMSLDDLVSQSSRGRRGGQGRGRGGRRGANGAGAQSTGGGALRSNRSRNSAGLTTSHAQTRASPYGGSRAGPGTKISVTNLHFNVNETDLWTLFSRCGHVRKVVLNFDRTGKSTGTAQIVFNNYNDALKAINDYHNVTLDGRSMKIELVLTPDTYQRQLGLAASIRGATSNRGRSSRGNRSQGRTGGSKTNASAAKTAEDLDREMEEYMNASQGPSTTTANGV